MSEDRRGFLTPEQEQKLDDLIVLKGIPEVIDGIAIRMADNTGLEKLKAKLLAEKPELLPFIYEVIDEIFAALP